MTILKINSPTTPSWAWTSVKFSRNFLFSSFCLSIVREFFFIIIFILISIYSKANESINVFIMLNRRHITSLQLNLNETSLVWCQMEIIFFLLKSIKNLIQILSLIIIIISIVVVVITNLIKMFVSAISTNYRDVLSTV